jgi:hypothetical protein
MRILIIKKMINRFLFKKNKQNATYEIIRLD